MKKLILLFAMSAMTLGAMAQKNTIFVSGNYGFSSTTSEPSAGGTSNTSTSYTFAPKIGYHFSDNQAVGVMFGLTGGESGGVSTTSTVFGAFYRHIFPLGDIFALYGDAGVSYADAQKEINVNIKPGVMARLGKGWALTSEFATLGYRSKDNGSTKTSEFGLDVMGSNGGFTFGIQKSFGLSGVKK
ncbi:MAG: outer membrane beta-barrel protein [Chitinophagales bacterium]|jgi:hypothetical protein|nr:outer membrane beta-barrel protein [Chitinophagales bacterium]